MDNADLTTKQQTLLDTIRTRIESQGGQVGPLREAILRSLATGPKTLADITDSARRDKANVRTALVELHDNYGVVCQMRDNRYVLLPREPANGVILVLAMRDEASAFQISPDVYAALRAFLARKGLSLIDGYIELGVTAGASEPELTEYELLVEELKGYRDQLPIDQRNQFEKHFHEHI
jgi:hypothetical protein